MSLIRFIHLTDSHVLKNVAKSNMLEGICKDTTETQQENTQNFEKLLADLPTLEVFDFVVITGDLVHEGDAEDYQYYKELLSSSFKVPVFLILGNHDRISDFQQVFHPEQSDTEYFYSEIIKDYRIIGLDTSSSIVSERQLNWLKEELKTKHENGTIVLLHNPLELLGNKMAILENSQDLLDVLVDTDVRLVLSGHVHQRFENIYHNILFSVAPGTAFGTAIEGNKVTFNQYTNYSIITMTKDEISVVEKEYPRHAIAYKSFTPEEMIEHDKKYN